jgi:hypothetical protein
VNLGFLLCLCARCCGREQQTYDEIAAVHSIISIVPMPVSADRSPDLRLPPSYLTSSEEARSGSADQAGRRGMVGLVTSETIGRMLMLHDAQPPGTQVGPWSRPAGA